MRLRDIQQQFINAMYSQSTPADGFIKPSATLTADERLAIYRGSVRGGLLNALSDIYPVLQKLLGAHAFEGLSRAYIKQYPSVSANIADYGNHFADFIDTFEPLADYPYLSDTARLEWSWHRVFHQADDTLLDLARLGEMPPEQQLALRFRLPHACQLLRSQFPIKQIWKANQTEHQSGHQDDLKGHFQDNFKDRTIELIQRDYYLLVWRRGYEMRIDELAENHWYFLSQLEQSACFSEAVEQFLTSYPEEDVSALFATAVGQGWIVDFE